MNWRHVGIGVQDNPRAQIYERAGVKVILGHEGDRWHMSISVERGYPTWDQIADARYHFINDRIDMALILPPPEDYVNLGGDGIHRHVFHLWEIRDEGLPTERGLAMPRTREDGARV